jgi:DNA-binding NarL/FixJ family response regulator
MKNLKILIADDHPLILKGMKTELLSHNYLNVYEANNGVEALQQLDKFDIDIAILDVDMPLMNGMEVVKRNQNQNIKTILMTHHKEDGFLIQAKLIGVDAYLLKEDAFSEVENAIHQIYKDQFYLSSSFESDKLVTIDAQILLLQNLSLAEQRVIKHVSEGFETKEIAELLSVSKRTIHKHRSHIISKLNLPSDHNSLSTYAVSNRQLIKEIF